MLEFDDIQHLLLTRVPALTGRYEFLSFRDPAQGRAWLAGLLDKVASARSVMAAPSGAALGLRGVHVERAAGART